MDDDELDRIEAEVFARSVVPEAGQVLLVLANDQGRWLFTFEMPPDADSRPSVIVDTEAGTTEVLTVAPHVADLMGMHLVESSLHGRGVG